MKALELQPLIKAAGYSESSINSRLEFLREKGIVERIGDGHWRLKETNAA
jgi:DNA-binding IclR family transcriptional regulator